MLWVGGGFLFRVQNFKHLLLTNDRKLEGDVDRRFGAASVVMQALYRTVVVKKELSHNAMLSQDALNLMPTQSNFD